MTIQRLLLRRKFACVGSCRLFSSVDAATPADAQKLGAAARQANQKPLFPWRHESAETLLPRLTAGTPEFTEDLAVPIPIQSILAFLFLDKGLFTATQMAWRDELADAAGSAFTHGVAALLANEYQIPVESSSDESQLDFNFPEKQSMNKDDNSDRASASPKPGEEESLSSSVERPAPSNYGSLEEMISRPLLDLYSSARVSGKDQLLVKLHTKPVFAVLYNVFCIPFMTRELAVREPRLLQETIQDLRSLQKSENLRDGFNRAVNHTETILKSANNPERPETTVEIQVLVKCEESFQVLDAETGVVLQGSQDGAIQPVFHLVRFETTVQQSPSDLFFNPFMKTQVGKWQMTDIDDLLGAKAWYQGEDNSPRKR